ncbi:MAG: ArsR family transcriptional regulator [Gemmatimonadales bacterium]
MTHPMSSRFLEGTPGRIVELLRDRSRTVEELADELGLTGSAVRLQLATLERDGLIRVDGRRPSGRKPALVYGLTQRADFLLSRGYVPVLNAVLDTISTRFSPAERNAMLREVGRRLVASAPPATGSKRDRLLAAARVVEQLGGRLKLETTGRTTALVASGCPLGELVQGHPEICRVVETVVKEVSGITVRERCERGDRPRCVFVVE